MIYKNSAVTIYFGNAADKLYKDEYQALDKTQPLLKQQKFAHLSYLMGINNLIFMNQIHSNNGISASEEQRNISSFKTEGDFLITQEKTLGIGIMTADCLPVLLHDSRNNAIGAVHAGWRGSVSQIILRAIDAMRSAYNTHATDLNIYFGPAAHACCYEVGDDFLKNISTFPFADQLIKEKNEKLFFDIIACNRLQLEQLGIQATQINTTYSQCTIENNSFFSHRRMPTGSGRQMSVIALNNN
ncbi:MAG: peptidoglycan editing factor PgeF [Candidatus Dependentiae bacterium]|nr:peptidoglycan editing factor PgeF [Candidatus Dependentiae bacterium]